MSNKMLFFVLLGALMMPALANAQCPYAGHENKLACLIPTVTQAGQSQNLGRFNTTVAQVLGQLPLAAPVSGFVLGFNKKLGIPEEESLNLGSVLTERGNTVGRHKVFLGFTFQRFVFQTIDGTKLNSLSSVFETFPSTCSNPDANGNCQGPGTITNRYGSSTNFLSANINQYTGIVAFGLTSRIDLSVTLPFERISMSGGYKDFTQGLITYNCGNPACSSGNTLNSAGTFTGQSQSPLPGSASGVGDLLVSLKGTIYNGEKSKLALGLETRFPTGDQFNLLGTGAYGLKPYIVLSRLGRITPHVNVGFQWNGYSNLDINPCYFAVSNPCKNGTGLPTLKLPASLDYSGGADVGLTKRLTFVADYVGQRFFNAPVVTAAVPASQATPPLPDIPSCTGSSSSNPICTTNIQSVQNFYNTFKDAKTVGVGSRSINENNVSLGLKFKPVAYLIISANALIRLDDGGLRPARFVPLVGVSYRF